MVLRLFLITTLTFMTEPWMISLWLAMALNMLPGDKNGVRYNQML